MRRIRINDNAAEVKRRSTGKSIYFKQVGQNLLKYKAVSYIRKNTSLVSWGYLNERVPPLWLQCGYGPTTIPPETGCGESQ